MAITSDTRTVNYVGNGSLATYAVPFEFFEEADYLVVTRTVDGTPTVLTNGVHYNVVGSNVVLTANLASGAVLNITRQMPITQEVELPSSGRLAMPALEEALDKATAVDQQQQEEIESEATARADEDSIIRTEFGAADSALSASLTNTAAAIRSEFATADTAVRAEFAAVDATIRDEIDSEIEALRSDLVANPLVASVLNVRNLYPTIGNGTRCATELQAVLDLAKANAVAGGAGQYVQVLVPDGLYLIDEILKIGSNVRLSLSHGATIRKVKRVNNSEVYGMIQNDADGVTGGYTANSNILIEGGVWDCNAAGTAVSSSPIAFGHCTKVEVRNLTVRNVLGFHHIEINSTKHARVVNCIFEDLVSAPNKEAVQNRLGGQQRCVSVVRALRLYDVRRRCNRPLHLPGDDGPGGRLSYGRLRAVPQADPHHELHLRGLQRGGNLHRRQLVRRAHPGEPFRSLLSRRLRGEQPNGWLLHDARPLRH